MCRLRVLVTKTKVMFVLLIAALCGLGVCNSDDAGFQLIAGQFDDATAGWIVGKPRFGLLWVELDPG